MLVRKWEPIGIVQDEADLPILWSEESGDSKIFFLSPEASVGELIRLPPVDWRMQAELSPFYREGLVRYPIADKELLLEPGPGFGDLSHPTTRLMVGLMEREVVDLDIGDVGCGNGVLTLAALLMGARSAYGIDIDETALVHAETNARLNGLTCEFSVPGESVQGKLDLVLLNMILSEQKTAMASLGFEPSRLIVSGLLLSQSDYWTDRGYTLMEESQEDDWWAGVLLKG